MIENTWRDAPKTATQQIDSGSRLSQATEMVTKQAADGRLYFCVIDRLCYGSLDTALVHVKMQHGMAFHGELLLRTKMIGGGH